MYYSYCNTVPSCLGLPSPTLNSFYQLLGLLQNYSGLESVMIVQLQLDWQVLLFIQLQWQMFLATPLSLEASQPMNTAFLDKYI